MPICCYDATVTSCHTISIYSHILCIAFPREARLISARDDRKRKEMCGNKTGKKYSASFCFVHKVRDQKCAHKPNTLGNNFRISHPIVIINLYLSLQPFFLSSPISSSFCMNRQLIRSVIGSYIFAQNHNEAPAEYIHIFNCHADGESDCHNASICNHIAGQFIWWQTNILRANSEWIAASLYAYADENVGAWCHFRMSHCSISCRLSIHQSEYILPIYLFISLCSIVCCRVQSRDIQYSCAISDHHHCSSSLRSRDFFSPSSCRFYSRCEWAYAQTHRHANDEYTREREREREKYCQSLNKTDKRNYSSSIDRMLFSLLYRMAVET